MKARFVKLTLAAGFAATLAAGLGGSARAASRAASRAAVPPTLRVTFDYSDT